MLDAGRYKANFTRGGLMVPESRIVADLLLAGADANGWRQAIEVDNVLAKRSVSTAATKATLIRGRLKTLPPALWGVIRDGSRPAATHAVLAGVINYSPLFGDFLDLVVRDLYRRFEPVLKPQHWDAYVEDCQGRDAAIPTWAPATELSLRRRVFSMMAEAGYLNGGRRHELTSLQISPEVISALKDAGQHYALRCIQVGSPEETR
ncbi:hypothetical protein CKO31_14890 [Thiohalocapsa halophila]|uniref:DUF1819 family protein n=1 Tax=Thiohalocapsa halophila TaxID=69359 RepID=A0ABS1CJA0_9GAMM|nr:DUF1819 family protein [Thiohalocapsa halophila]MBK1631999.1 hypothetical protein [Thiohalocapsa halophila]